MLNYVLGVILHNLSTRNRLVSLTQAHKGKVSGLCFADGDRLLSCGVDRNIKLWSIASGSSTTVRTQFPVIFSDIPNFLVPIAPQCFPGEISIQV